MTMDQQSIGAVEREIGIKKDTLRVWERRYGFPAPLRDALGERLYPADQIERLRLIKQLLDGGHRPGKVVGLDPATLRAMVDATLEVPQLDEAGQAIIDAIIRMDVQAVQQGLSRLLLRHGLERFTIDHLAPLVRAVGLKWASGCIAIHSEHLFTEQAGRLLSRAIAPQMPLVPRQPILLTTLSGERHSLGIRMAEAVIAAHGRHVVSIGPDLPVAQIAMAASGYNASAVALSISTASDPGTNHQAVAALRVSLPPRTELWLGGQGAERIRNLPGRTRRFTSLDELTNHLMNDGSDIK